MSKRTVSDQNALLNPAFWGSLLAILIALIMVAFHSAIRGLPPHLSAFPDDFRLGIYCVILALVGLITLRCYVVISMHIYGGSPRSIMRLPKGRTRIFALVVNSAVIFLCGICAAFASSFSISLALISCILICMCCICLFVLWMVAKSTGQTDQIKDVKSIFGIGDVIVALILLWLLANLGDQNFKDFVFAGPIACFLLTLFFVYEWYVGYRHEFKKQRNEAWARLTN